ADGVAALRRATQPRVKEQLLLSGVGTIFRDRRRCGTFQPQLAEVRRDQARTEDTSAAVVAAAQRVLQREACGFHRHHLAAALVDDLIHPPAHRELAAAVGNLLRPDPDAAILIVLIERTGDLV